MVRVLGGAGEQAVAVFDFGKSSTLVKDDLNLVVKKASRGPNRTIETLNRKVGLWLRTD